MIKIKKIKSREIIDSKGIPTVEVDLETEKGVFRASAPSGVSIGKNEALELRDKEERFSGKGVLNAIKNIEEIISPALIKKGKIKSPREIDDILINLDGTENKSFLGANAILPVSVAACRAMAKEEKLPLYQYISDFFETKIKIPQPCFLMIEGGEHAGNTIDIQEFMVTPECSCYKEQLEAGNKIYYQLKNILRKNYGEFSTNVGLEGGFAAPLGSNIEALELIIEAVQKSGFENKVKIILDVAASAFYKNNSYNFEGSNFSTKGLLDFYSEIIKKYPIWGIEDPFDEEDWKGFKDITEKFGNKVSIIGDDLLVTNIDKIKKAVEKNYCNGLILKINQIGTVTESVDAAKLALDNNWNVFVKHRSGETCDDFISDLATGLGVGWIMAGAITRGERVSKYNRLLRIDEKIK